MKTIYTILFQFLIISAFSQVNISGTVSSQSGEPIAGANLFIQGSYDGSTTDSLGQFQFKTSLSGTQMLIASYVGYETQGINLEIVTDISNMNIMLIDNVSELNEVVINAGTFEASDKKKSAVLNSIDVATTAGATGDIYGAFGTMPGSHKVGEEGRLFVRGGEAYETKTYMDGMLVSSPYYSKLPDLPTRGRFSPLLFNGAVFSTGGYSAEYGQALSSIVSLNTVALEPEDKSSISVITVGVQGSHAKRWENTSLAVTADFLHLGLSNRLFKQNIEWLKDPVTTGSTMMFRHKTSQTGMIKSFGSFSYNTSSLQNNNFQESVLQDITLNNANAYINTTYNEMHGEKWMINSGVSYNLDNEKTRIDNDQILLVRKSGQIKACFTNFTTNKIKTKMGGDFIFNNYRQEIKMDGNFTLPFKNNQLSAFIETEIKINSIFAIRAGGRIEHSSLLQKTKVMPRISSALKTGKNSQLSMAFGTFYQNPQDDYLKLAPTLSPEKSTHSILTWQYKKNTRTLRIEAYSKKYSNLVKFKEEYSAEPNNYANSGKGYSNGIDILWRDKKSFDKGDYWISYSWNDSRRNYRDFKLEATPHYVSEHNLSVVYKRFFQKINSIWAVTYSFASGRPYYNPNNSDFMSDRTKSYNDMSLSITHLMFIFDKQAVIHLVVNNVLGFNNIYGYTFNNTPDNRGIYHSQPVTPPSKRMIVALVSFQL
ncbi:MAG: TonB-dependent receptor [Mariniphaga sp.]|nr:TonB-dependent receptor [Mariniphaga sp.]